VLDFAWSAEDRTVRLNFLGERLREKSPLSDAHLPDRRRELRDLMKRAANDHPDAESLRGRSWLYGLDAYRRICSGGRGAQHCVTSRSSGIRRCSSGVAECAIELSAHFERETCARSSADQSS